MGKRYEYAYIEIHVSELLRQSQLDYKCKIILNLFVWRGRIVFKIHETIHPTDFST